MEIPLATAGEDVPFDASSDRSDARKLIKLEGCMGRSYILRRSKSVESTSIFGPIRLGPSAQILSSE